MIFRLFLLLIASSLLISCNSSKEKEESANGLAGNWKSYSLKVEKITDSSELLEVDISNWESKLKIRPIVTEFNADNTWASPHYNLNDSLLYRSSGTWRTEGDQLIMIQVKPTADTVRYTFSIQKDTATFTAILDWDGDGEKDDKYFGRQTRQ